MILLYVIFYIRRRLKEKEKDQLPKSDSSSRNYENVGSVNTSVYQEPDLSKMGGEENYQSLQMNTKSSGNQERESEVGYAELNKVKGNSDDNYYQALNRT